MQKNLIFGGIVLLLVILLAFWYERRGADEAIIPSLAPLSSQNTAPEEPTEALIVPFDSVSLPALMEKTYEGRGFTVGSVLDDNSAYSRYYITYQSGSLTISGIMNVPKGTAPATGWPVLFLNHGYIDPAIYTNGRGLKREQDYLARHGYAVIHSDYRNYADSTDDPENDVRFRLGYVEDVINAVMAVRTSGLQYLDGERVGMLGHSMGGGVTTNILVVKPDLVDGAVLFAPVSADNRDNFKRWTESRRETAERILALHGSPDANPTFWDNISANRFFDRIETPILLHHGTADESVPIAWSDRMMDELKQAGQDIQYERYPGEPHEFTVAWPTVMARTLAFFDTHVKNSP